VITLFNLRIIVVDFTVTGIHGNLSKKQVNIKRSFTCNAVQIVFISNYLKFDMTSYAYVPLIMQ